MPYSSTVCRLLVGIGVVEAFAATVMSQESGSLTFNEPFRGTIPTKLIGHPGRFGVGTFGTYLPLKVEQGQRLTISADAVGDGRKIGLIVMDPGGILLNEGKYKEGSEQVTFNEMGASGIHKIYVISDRPGGFRLQVTSPKLPIPRDGQSLTMTDAKAIESRIQQLESELADLRAKLQKIRYKSNNE